MKLLAISDPHLNLSKPEKDMIKFGEKWKDYVYKLKTNWEKEVGKNDIVILPGDISWATRLHEIYNDFKFIDDLPGSKLFSKGNHDYWYTTHKKTREYIESNFSTIKSIERTAYNLQDKYIITGFKGFNVQLDEPDYTKQSNSKYYSLSSHLEDINKTYPDIPIILSTHFPPFDKERRFLNLFKDHNIRICIYGHIHDNYCAIDLKDYFVVDNIEFYFVASDFLQFKPKVINI